MLLVSSVCLGLLTACSDSTGSSGNVPGRVAFFPYGYPQAVSPDGKTVMFQNLGGATGAEIYLYDVATRQTSLVATAGPNPNDIARGISNDGVIASSYEDPVQAATWSQAGGWQVIASPFASGCPPFAGDAFGVSDDGSVAVGSLWEGCANQAFISSGGVTTMLERLGTNDFDSIPSSRASVVSNDGTTAAGSSTLGALDRVPAVWHADGSGFLVPTGGVFPDDCPGEINALSADGSMAAGVWCEHAFYWTQVGGPVDLGLLPGTDASDGSFANAIADGTQLIFGTNGKGGFDGGPQSAFVWTASKGMRSLQDVAKEYFVQFPGSATLLTASAASADGTVVIGQGLDAEGNFGSYVLTMPVSAYGL